MAQEGFEKCVCGGGGVPQGTEYLNVFGTHPRTWIGEIVIRSVCVRGGVCELTDVDDLHEEAPDERDAVNDVPEPLVVGEEVVNGVGLGPQPVAQALPPGRR